MSIQYITEDEAKTRAQKSTGQCRIFSYERLTPAAAEYLRANNCTIVQAEKHPISFENASSIPIPGETVAPVAEAVEPSVAAPVASAACVCKPCAGSTYLDAETRVLKSHPRIEIRGRLDSLIAVTVLVQTQFDSQNRLPGLLKSGLNDIKNWLWQILASDVSGEPVGALSAYGMNAEMIHAVSLDPQTYLGQGHIVPDAALGQNVALLNWLRTEAREIEVVLAKHGDREDLLEACNRLSTAVYVLMLLTVVAEQGRDISNVSGK